MIREKFNENWSITKGCGKNLMEMFQAGEQEKERLTLPHDAMIHEERSKDTGNASQTGFYPGGGYRYEKMFFVPREWEAKTVTLEFEGAYTNARVFINGGYAGGHPNGYTNFYVCADHFLKYGEENKIEVSVNNSMELNSRWYSGSGLYRNVNLLVGNSLHIPVDGVRVSTPQADCITAVVAIETAVVNAGKNHRKIAVRTELFEEDGSIKAADTAYATVYGGTQIKMNQRITVLEPKLWDCDQPFLYQCKVTILDGIEEVDKESLLTGIRTLQLDSANGLRINGKTVKLRGACIHHDNGLIGACTLERAEERRCEIMKQAGFNSIRSSHHPVSRAMLEACDRHGMLVIDELSDMWTISKNQNDYAAFFTDYWKKDVEQMVAKAFNHPSVIIYSMGNEIQEAGTSKGAEMNRLIDNYIKALDTTRFTTNAINGMLAVMDSMGEIMADLTGMSREAMQKAASQDKETESAEQNQGGSDALNGMIGLLVGPMADALAVHPKMTESIKEFSDAMDIAGYNYMTGRHEEDHRINPNRIVLGAETFPADIVRLWDIVKKNSHVIGDMTWTGYDYLGEAGIGIFYYDGTVNFTPHWPDRIAYIGDIDITGYRRPISYLREVVFGLRKEPYVAVERLNRNGQTPNQTAWMWKDNIASWTWPGFDDQMASIDVYADAQEVELFLNGMSLGRKPAGEAAGYIAQFQVPYQPGELKAVGYSNQEETGSHILKTAEERVVLDVQIDREVLRADGADLSYITVGLKDEKGNSNLHTVKEVSIAVEGDGSLQGFGSANPQSEGSYDDTKWETYDGYVTAVIRAGKKEGSITVTLSAEGCETVRRIIQIKGV